MKLYFEVYDNSKKSRTNFVSDTTDIINYDIQSNC